MHWNRVVLKTLTASKSNDMMLHTKSDFGLGLSIGGNHQKTNAEIWSKQGLSSLLRSTESIEMKSGMLKMPKFKTSNMPL